jgi:hypothetical protein
MSFVLSCKLSDRIAAVGAVAAADVLPWSWCTDSRPVPMIAFHGTADEIIPYGGGPSRYFDIPFPALPDCHAPDVGLLRRPSAHEGLTLRAAARARERQVHESHSPPLKRARLRYGRARWRRSSRSA